MNTIESFNEHIMSTYGRLPVVLDNGSGCHATDESGKQYIDFGSGIGTNSLGYCNSAWADAVCAQAHAMQHTSNYFYTKVQSDFAARLCEITGYSKMFFGNSGAEANECAIKLARKYSFDKYGKGRSTIITLVNSFHGRTLTTLSATGQDVFHNYFFPFTEGFVFAEANNIDDLKSKLDGTVCAVMIEFVQGEGGVNALDKDYVTELFRICKENDILTVADEVQTGVGRTGHFLAASHFGVKANVTTLAKGIAGGLPMGVCLADNTCADVLTKGTHGSTFGGNPVCCAAGNAVLDTLTAPGFLQEVMQKSEYFRNKLMLIDEVEGVDGLGLMIGVRLKSKKASDILTAAAENGLLILTAKDKLRFLPPLNISYDDIDAGLAIIENLLK